MKEKWNRFVKSISWNEVAKCAFMALLPLVCCMVHCLVRGQSLGNVYLPNCEWNDELFYYKQVEAILSHGYPRGYFGFNESHALKLSFAAWSPVLVWPWLIYGFLFGWNLMSPIYCNILLMMITMVIFTKLTKMTWKQCFCLSIMFVTFTPFVRYMLSTMPEIICFCMVIVYLALLYADRTAPSRVKLGLLLGMALMMTWMRPYLILFLLYPCYRMIRGKKWIGVLTAAFAFAVAAIVYYAINHYLGAAYFKPLFKTEWLDPFLQGHILSGIKGIVVKLYYEGKTFAALTLEGMISGLAEGAFFVCFMTAMVILGIQTFADLWKMRLKQALIHGYLCFSFFAMWMALLLMYKMKEGSKHLLTFIVMGIFSIALMQTKFYKKTILMAALFGYLFWVRGDHPVDYAIPYQTEERVEQMQYWEQVFDENLSLLDTTKPSYENVVIWCFADGELLADWQVLYALPSGFGISCCYEEYVLENLESLQSKYLLIPTGGNLESACNRVGFPLVGCDGKVAVYETTVTIAGTAAAYTEELEDIHAGTYEALYLSMPRLGLPDQEVFNTYRGQNTYVFPDSDYTVAEICTILEGVESETLEDLFLYIEPTDANIERLPLQEFRAKHPRITVYVLGYMQSMDSWKNPEMNGAETREEMLERTGRNLQSLLAQGARVFFPGDCDWLTENRDNYTVTDQGSECYAADIRRHLLISMICDGRFEVTGDNLDMVMQGFRRNILEGQTTDEIQQDFRKAYDGNPAEETWVMIGDSLIGNYTGSLSIPGVIQCLSGIEIINCGYGGVRLTPQEGEVSGYSMVECLTVGNPGDIPQKVPAYEGVTKAHEVAEKAKMGDGAVIYFISFGINDFIQGVSLMDYEDTYRRTIANLRAYHPDAKIVLLTPTYIDSYEGGTQKQAPAGGTIEDYRNVVMKVASDESVSVIDLYNILPFSQDSAYLADGIHPSELGRYTMGRTILNEMSN